MPARKINPHMTLARRVWLGKLATEGPARRGKTTTGYQCMHLGWTEWDYHYEGKPISATEAIDRLGNGWREKVKDNNLERITEAGRAALARSRGDHP